MCGIRFVKPDVSDADIGAQADETKRSIHPKVQLPHLRTADELEASEPVLDRACLIVDIVMGQHIGLDVVEVLLAGGKAPR